MCVCVFKLFFSVVIISVFGEGQQISGGWSWWKVSNRSCNNKCLAVCCADCAEVPLLLSKLCLTPLSIGDHLWETGKEKGAPSHIGVDSGWRGENDWKREDTNQQWKELTGSKQSKRGETRETAFFESPEILG